MNEARVPDSETDWRNVDIFLFSNGQKQTPPRKYHLNSEDLSRWSSTLMHLARSHYGEIFSSVDLYTVDGEVVATPLQLSNGAAYVAVPPQDTFIPSGYNDYLLKAIRSREKRRNAQAENQRDGLDTQIQEAETEAKEEVEKVETLNEMTNNATTSTIGDRVNSVQKLQPQYPASRNSSLKHTEKITHNNNSSSILKKQNSLMLPSTVRKGSMKLKENPLRKNLKVNTSKGPNSGSTIITNSSNQLKTNSRTPTRTGKNGDRQSSLRNANDRSKIENKGEPQSHNSILGTIKSSSEKTETKEISAFENVIDDNELIVVKKQESVNRSMVFTDLEKKDTAPSKRNRLSSMVPILMPIEESRLSKDEPPVTAINNVIENVYKPEADIISGMTSVNKSKMELDDNIAQGTATNIQQLQEDKMKLINKHPVDSFIAVIDKGDLIDLNLKIQVRKCEGVISTQDSKPFINSIIQKASQVNIDQEIVETIEKRSSLKNKLTIDEDNTKLVVIQCSCCENRNLSEILQKIDTGTVKLNDKKYVIVLPDPPSHKTVERIKSTRDEITEKEKSLSPTRLSQSTRDEIKVKEKSLSPTRLSQSTRDEIKEKEISLSPTRLSQSTRDEIKEKEKSLSPTRLSQSTRDEIKEKEIYLSPTRLSQSTRDEIKEKEISLSLPRLSVFSPVKKVYATTSIDRLAASKTTQDVGTTMSDLVILLHSRDANAQNKPEVAENDEINRNVSSMRKIYQAESLTSTKHKPSSQKILVDTSTQTEWCSMLMEAKRHDDGRYSFYLPPLHVLKNYGL